MNLGACENAPCGEHSRVICVLTRRIRYLKDTKYKCELDDRPQSEPCLLRAMGCARRPRAFDVLPRPALDRAIGQTQEHEALIEAGRWLQRRSA